jgi:hypothetical protein
MAVIADVHTDPNTKKVMEVGVGNAMDIYVAAPIEGRVVLCRGAIFSNYKFLQPMSNRITDEEWQGMLADETNPPMPEWTTLFTADSLEKKWSKWYDDVKTISVEVENEYNPDDTVRVTIIAGEQPTVSVSSGARQPETVPVTGTADSTYHAVLPSNIGGVEQVVLEIEAGTVYYRKLLRNNATLTTGSEHPPNGAAAAIGRMGRAVRFPPGFTGKIYDLRGRIVGTVPAGTRLFHIPESLAGGSLIIKGEMEKKSLRMVVPTMK